MKILSKEEYNNIYIERYDLNEIFSENGLNKGLIICYTLSKNPNVKLLSLDFETAHEEIGVPLSWEQRYSESSFKEIFPSIESFLKAFDGDDFGNWSLKLIYKNTEIEFNGQCNGKDSTVIAVSYSKDVEIELLSLLSSVEKDTHKNS